nr:hypothetical protein [Crucivirus sp.]
MDIVMMNLMNVTPLIEQEELIEWTNLLFRLCRRYSHNKPKDQLMLAKSVLVEEAILVMKTLSTRETFPALLAVLEAQLEVPQVFCQPLKKRKESEISETPTEIVPPVSSCNCNSAW